LPRAGSSYIDISVELGEINLRARPLGAFSASSDARSPSAYQTCEMPMLSLVPACDDGRFARPVGASIDPVTGGSGIASAGAVASVATTGTPTFGVPVRRRGAAAGGSAAAAGSTGSGALGESITRDGAAGTAGGGATSARTSADARGGGPS